MRILAITSNQCLWRRVKSSLSEHFTIDHIPKGAIGLYSVQEPYYSGLIIDSDLPDMGGSNLCSQIRQQGITTPIIMINATEKLSERVSSLNQGADAVLSKIFEPSELLATLKSLLRRFADGSFPANNIYQVGNITVDLWNQVVRKGSKVVFLRKKEFALLNFFIRNKGRVLPREMIQDTLWQDSLTKDSNVVDVCVCSLRKDLRNLAGVNLIKTVYGAGYAYDDSHLQSKS